jgi:hypothetical protein
MKFVKNLLPAMFIMLMMGMHSTAHAARSVVLEEPGPISVPTDYSYSMDEVKKAIIGGATKHQWRIDSEKPGIVRIILDGRRDHAVLVMDVVYDQKSYSIKYVRSEALDYQKGIPAGVTANPNSNTVSVNTSDHQKTTIHSSYARWMKLLVQAINTELIRTMAK